MTRLTLIEQIDLMQRAKELIELGARMQVLEDLTPMPREKLLRLYKEVRGCAPARGLLPFSTEWFLEWQPSIHTALYLSQRNSLKKLAIEDTPKELLPQSYRAYIDCLACAKMPTVLSLTRAWSLERFLQAKMLREVECSKCEGVFVAHSHDPVRGFVCGLCKAPPRAGNLSTFQVL